jgi:hypothetical protein
MVLALSVVFVMLSTTGWTAVQHHGAAADPLSAALGAWRKGTVGRRHLPSPAAPPRRIAAFFASLSRSRQTQLADRYPLVVGNLGGAPVELRYRANRLELGRQVVVEQERLRKGGLSASGREDVESTVLRYEELMSPDRQILAFDPSGRGLAAEVHGDLVHAGRVSVVVPGVDTDILSFQKDDPEDDPYSAPAGMASALYDQERRADPVNRTAVIAWADYVAPVGLGMDAAIAPLAQAGAVRLSALLQALPGSAPVALFCHSYGSVVCGLAAHHLPRRVTDVAVAASPGMRVHDAAGLHTSARIWAMRDYDDWVRDVPYVDLAGVGHGADPVSPAFGARVVSAAGAHGHAGYFDPGTVSLHNFAAIGVGDRAAVVCAQADERCRA